MNRNNFIVAAALWSALFGSPCYASVQTNCSFELDELAQKIKERSWQKLNTVPYNGKQDDLFFVNPDTGWYANGDGFIYKTTDGGASWSPQLHKPGTYFRSLGFIDALNGYAGNIGPDYFPNVTDANPLYETHDGGATWAPVKDVTSKEIIGVCSIDVLKTKFINAGHLDNRVTIRAAGRVGGPAMMATSRDGGKTWKSEDLTSVAGMILDVKFIDERTGFLFASSHYDVTQSHARILKTIDGGTTWKIVYESSRPFDLNWKGAFAPNSKVGYASVINFDPDPTVDQRIVVKTADGGDHWQELPLTKNHDVQEFGVGFINEQMGWVGAIEGGFLTLDGGATWAQQEMGRAVNKIRVVTTPQGPVVFAIGIDVRKLDLRTK